MADCPQFQLMPQVMSMYHPQPPSTQPPPPPNAFPIPPGQPMFPIPPHFGYPPIAWSPIHHYPPPPPLPLTPQQPAHDHAEEDDNYNAQQIAFNNNNNNSSSNNKNINSTDDSQNNLELQSSQRPNHQMFTRNVSNKVSITMGFCCVRRGKANTFLFWYLFKNIYLAQHGENLKVCNDAAQY